MTVKIIFVPVMVLLSAAVTAAASIPAADYGPVASWQTGREGGDRFKALGPFVERSSLPNKGGCLSFRPFFNIAEYPESERSLVEILWPVFSHKTFRNETHWRFLTVIGHDFDNTDDDSRWRLMGFPFVYAGRSAQGENYFAFFPLGGKINEFMGMDTIVFALFPLYVHSRAGNLSSHTFLWPLISRTTGKDVSRFRVFPLYGRSVNEGRWRKQFILWPFWNSVKYDYPDAKGGGFILFPFFGHAAVGDQSTWWIVPPFFRWSETPDQRLVYCPWPFIQYASGKIDKLYIWPIWGRRTSGEGKNRTTSGFFLWPLGWTYRTARDEGELFRFMFLPFIRSETVAAKPSNGPGEPSTSSRYFKFWPVGSYRRHGEAARFRVLDLWPGSDSEYVDRTWAPFWTIYDGSWSPERADHEFLWGLIRYNRYPAGGRHFSVFPLFSTDSSVERESRRWSILKGLIGYERDAGGKTLRLLYIPIGLPGNGKDKE
ncbi:MAG: hypothetical protein R6V03_07250 [Kiritimatiellia bacterium]